MKTVEYYMPTRVISGKNSLSQIGSQAAGMGKKALLVTGKAAMRKLGVTDRVIKYLKSEKIDVTLFDQVESNPKTEIVKVIEGEMRSIAPSITLTGQVYFKLLKNLILKLRG